MTSGQHQAEPQNQPSEEAQNLSCGHRRSSTRKGARCLGSKRNDDAAQHEARDKPGALPRRRDEPHETRARERVHHGQSDKGDKRQKLKPKGREVHPMQAVDPTAQERPIARIGHEQKH